METSFFHSLKVPLFWLGVAGIGLILMILCSLLLNFLNALFPEKNFPHHHQKNIHTEEYQPGNDPIYSRMLDDMNRRD
jgi:hypothetical protein